MIFDTLAMAVAFAEIWGDVPGYPFHDEREFMWIVDQETPAFVGLYVAEWAYMGGDWFPGALQAAS